MEQSHTIAVFCLIVAALIGGRHECRGHSCCEHGHRRRWSPTLALGGIFLVAVSSSSLPAEFQGTIGSVLVLAFVLLGFRIMVRGLLD